MAETMPPLGGLDWRALISRWFFGGGRTPFGPVNDRTSLGQVPSLPVVIGLLPDGRPIVRNPDGSTSTHRNIGVNLGGQEFILPTMYGGGEVPVDRAVDIARQTRGIDPTTGWAFPRFRTQGESEDYEQRWHQAMERGQYVPLGAWPRGEK